MEQWELISADKLTWRDMNGVLIGCQTVGWDCWWLGWPEGTKNVFSSLANKVIKIYLESITTYFVQDGQISDR